MERGRGALGAVPDSKREACSGEGAEKKAVGKDDAAQKT